MNQFSKPKIIVVVVALLFIVGATGFFLWSRTIDKDIDGIAANVHESTKLGDEYKIYTNDKYGFSLEYPQDFFIETFDEGDGAETIVFQGRVSSGQDKIGFQVFISPIEEAGELTRERILEDVPYAVIDEAQEVLLGPKNDIRGLLFWSEDPDIGRTREVWFAHENYLYEITTYEHLDMWLAGILSTWEFNE